MQVRNPQFLSDGESVDCEVSYDGETWRQFTAVPGDGPSDEVLQVIADNSINVAAYTPRARTAEDYAAMAQDIVDGVMRPSIREMLGGLYATGQMAAEDLAGWEAGVYWTAAVQSEATRAFLAGEDPVWPEVPSEAEALAARF